MHTRLCYAEKYRREHDDLDGKNQIAEVVGQQPRGRSKFLQSSLLNSVYPDMHKL